MELANGSIIAHIMFGDQSEPERFNEEFKKRRDVFVKGLNQIKGFSCRMPHGAFYTFPNVTGTGFDARTLQAKLLEEAGVATVAGTSFGEFGEGFLRFSYANSREAIGEAVERIRKFLGNLPGGDVAR